MIWAADIGLGSRHDGDVNTLASRRWFSDLVAVVASSPQLAELTGFTVSFVVDGEALGLDLVRRVPTDAVQACCHLVGKDDVFERLVRGGTTLQKAYRTGELEMSGDPQSLLRLAFLFERTSTALGN